MFKYSKPDRRSDPKNGERKKKEEELLNLQLHQLIFNLKSILWMEFNKLKYEEGKKGNLTNYFVMRSDNQESIILSFPPFVIGLLIQLGAPKRALHSSYRL